MKLNALTVLGVAMVLSSCAAADPNWQRMVPPSHVEPDANGCPMYTIDDAAPLSQWKTIGAFWDQDVCQGIPFQTAQMRGRMDQSREWIRQKAEKGDQNSIKIAKCWDHKDYMTWTASASDSLIRHDWDAVPYACVRKDDPRLTQSSPPSGTPQFAGK